MLPWIYVADIASNQATRIRLDSNLFGVGNAPQFAQDTATNRAVVALSPDGGAPHGAAPLNIFIDLATGKQTQFSGLNNGLYGAGTVNGLAVDSTTGVACTTTELNAQVEFYALATGRGVSTQLPNTQDTANSTARRRSRAIRFITCSSSPNRFRVQRRPAAPSTSMMKEAASSKRSTVSTSQARAFKSMDIRALPSIPICELGGSTDQKSINCNSSFISTFGAPFAHEGNSGSRGGPATTQLRAAGPGCAEPRFFARFE